MKNTETTTYQKLMTENHLTVIYNRSKWINTQRYKIENIPTATC